LPQKMSTEELTARVELRALVDEYAWALDSSDPIAYAHTFTPDGELTQVNPGETEPAIRWKGTEELREAPLTEQRFHRVFHAVQNHRVSVEGDRGTGVTYVTVHHLERKGSGWASLIVLVQLHDEYQLTDAGWKFARRQIRQQWCEMVDADLSPFDSDLGED
jgi:hypothetical protein